MSDPADPAPAPESAPAPEPVPGPDPVPVPGPPAAAADGGGPGAPALAASPGWVPAAVVAGAVLLVEGLIVSRIRPEGEGAASFVASLASVGFLLGGLSLLAGYVAFLLARASLPRALEALVLTAVGAGAYAWIWRVVIAALSGESASLPGISQAGLEGKWANVASLGWILVAGAAFVFAFRWMTAIVWPFFRSAVALNVLLMVHLVVGLLGTVSVLNVKHTPSLLGTGLDLTETSQYSLADKTRAILGKVDGELRVYLVDFGAARRGGPPVTGRVDDLLRQFKAACPGMDYRNMDAFRSGEELRRELTDAGMESALASLSGEEDAVLLGYRPPGEKLIGRTKVVPISAEFTDTSALGSARFRGESILANAVNEVAFVQRRVLVLEGHGERSLAAAAGGESVSLLAEALRADNFAVGTHVLAKEPRVPAGTDLVIAAGPLQPFTAPEVEALRDYLAAGGSLLLLLDVADAPEARTGLEDFLAGWGLEVRRDAVVVSWIVEETVTRGAIPTPTFDVFASKDEFGRHPSMAALKNSDRDLVLAFRAVAPVLPAAKPPEGVDVQELVYAPRDVKGHQPWGAIVRPGRFKNPRQEPGDIVRRLPLASVAERRIGASEKGGGRVMVFGDVDFTLDARLAPGSPYSSPANRTLVMNAVSWAVRRDLIAIDPKTVESEVVQVTQVQRDLAFWTAVVGLPVLVLGIAVGVWWSRRR